MSTNSNLTSNWFPQGWRARLIFAGGAAICVGVWEYAIYEVVKSRRSQKSTDVISYKINFLYFSQAISIVPLGFAIRHRCNRDRRDLRTKCMKVKNDGNDQFRKSQYQNSTNCYTEAINLCPEGLKFGELSSKYYIQILTEAERINLNNPDIFCQMGT